jgi:AAA+ ATPase superfamily predicted ATPase
MRPRSFIGRESELRALSRELDRARPSLVVVFGRRRVGKSTLLVYGTASRESIYYQASRIAASENIALFKREIVRVLGESRILDSLHDWLGLLSYLEDAARADHPGLTVVLDEFPYLCEVDPGLPSLVQKVWDGVRSRGTPLKLVLCGSKISFMEKLLAERNPLHGRQTMELDIGPLTYRESAQFFPGWALDDQVYAYGIFGGIPYYLDLCDPGASLEENVREIILEKGAPLSDEPIHILQAELQTVTRYATILRAVAGGCTTSGEIIGRVPEIRDASQLAPYVQKLQGLRLIRVVRSLDASERERDRRYYLDDPFLAFWYRFCLPQLSALASGHAGEVYRFSIAPSLDDYMGDVFEWICRDYIRLYAQEILGVPASEVGQIWAAGFDLDVAGTLLDRNAVFGECKWWRDRVGENVLDHLIENAGQTAYGRDAPGREYFVFSRSGFTGHLEARAARDPALHLAGLGQLLAR